jgi:hypothetical protein
MARPERFELPTLWFVARYSIQLSYGRFEAAYSTVIFRTVNCIIQLMDNSCCCRKLQKNTNWRRERDSNPRWAFGPYSLSRGAPSASRSSLREGRDNSTIGAKKKRAGEERLAFLCVWLKNSRADCRTARLFLGNVWVKLGVTVT